MEKFDIISVKYYNEHFTFEGKYMTEKLIINGVNIDKAYEDLCEIRNKIRQDSLKFMSDNIEFAQSLTQKLSKIDDVEEITLVANQAFNLLIDVQRVSDLSGLEYYLPYSSHNSLLSSYHNKAFTDIKEIEDLKELFDELETQTNRWNASYC